MAKKQKKTLDQMNNGEKVKAYRTRRYGCTAAKYGSIITPFVVIFGVKFNEYFALVDQGTQIKLSIGCILAMIVAVIAVYIEIKNDDKKKHLSGAVGWGIAFAFAFLFSSILNDLALILGVEFAGQCVAKGFDVASGKFKEEQLQYTELARKDGTLLKKRT